MALTSYTEVQAHSLLDIAAASIRHGLEFGAPLVVDAEDYDRILQAWRASFVTLEMSHSLRGCIGTLTAIQPLIQDVAQQSYAAAFRDPRFPPVSIEEMDNLSISISILTEPTPITFSDEADLCQQLRPGIDGLILDAPGHYATFLPAVWEQVGDAAEFIQHLKLKMGLAPGDWPRGISAQRYETISIG